MSDPVLLGFAENASPAQVPSALAIIELDGCGAIISREIAASDLLAISKNLLTLQRETRLIPLRPAPIPRDLENLAAQLAPKMAQNFEMIGNSVEFVVQMPLSLGVTQTSEPEPRNYLKSALEQKQRWQRAVEEAVDGLGEAISLLESKAIATKRGEPNVKEIASLHYAMTSELTSDVVNQWQENRAAWSTRKAVLAGPWAPFSFVNLDS